MQLRLLEIISIIVSLLLLLYLWTKLLLLQGNYGLNSPTSHHGSVSPNFQQQGTSSTYMHQSVTSPQQNYTSMLSPPPPNFHQNHQIQFNNSTSFTAQERTRSRSGGVQQLRVQLYPRQRSEEPQVIAKLHHDS